MLESFLNGFLSFFNGLLWFRSNPRYLLLLYLPCLIALVVFCVGILTLIWNFTAWQQLFVTLVPNQLFSWRWMFYGGLFFFTVGGISVWAVLCFLLLNIAAAPIFDVVSKGMEFKILGHKPVDMDFWKGVASIWTEIKKSILILLVTLVFSVIPPLILLAPFVVAFLVVWDFFDFPFSRRGLSLKQRLLFMRQNSSALFGLSLWLLIPGASLLLYPLVLGGATHLALNTLVDRQIEIG